MPSSDIDNLIVMLEHINPRLEPVKYQVQRAPVETELDSGPTRYRIQKFTGPSSHWKTIITGPYESIRGFINGLNEGNCATLRRW